jgi:outer membrane lipoprotein-sorting protein
MRTAKVSKLVALFATGLAASWLALFLTAGSAVALELEILLQSQALEGRREVAFEERRFIKSVTTPIVSRGHFVFQPPDRLTKIVEEPRRESAVIEGDRLTILDAEDREVTSIDLWLQPDLRLIFASIRGVLKGDPEILRSAFWISLHGQLEDWSLELSPKVDESKTRIHHIAISGNATGPQSFEVRETNGNRAQIEFLLDAPKSQ